MSPNPSKAQATSIVAFSNNAIAHFQPLSPQESALIQGGSRPQSCHGHYYGHYPPTTPQPALTWTVAPEPASFRSAADRLDEALWG